MSVLSDLCLILNLEVYKFYYIISPISFFCLIVWCFFCIAALPLAESQCQNERGGRHGLAPEDLGVWHCRQSQETFYGWHHLRILLLRHDHGLWIFHLPMCFWARIIFSNISSWNINLYLLRMMKRNKEIILFMHVITVPLYVVRKLTGFYKRLTAWIDHLRQNMTTIFV